MQHNQWLSDAAVCGVGRLELDGLAQVIELIGRIEMTQLLWRYLRRTDRSAAEQLGAAGGASDLDFSTPPPLFLRGGGRASSRARRSSPPASERFICWVPGVVRALWSGRNRNLSELGSGTVALPATIYSCWKSRMISNSICGTYL